MVTIIIKIGVNSYFYFHIHENNIMYEFGSQFINTVIGYHCILFFVYIEGFSTYDLFCSD